MGKIKSVLKGKYFTTDEVIQRNIWRVTKIIAWKGIPKWFQAVASLLKQYILLWWVREAHALLWINDHCFLKVQAHFSSVIPHVNDVISRLPWAPQFSIWFGVEGDWTESLLVAYLEPTEWRQGAAWWKGPKPWSQTDCFNLGSTTY